MQVHYQEKVALGCRVQLALVATSSAVVEPLFKELWLEILLFEKRCSRFLPNSELSRFNRMAGIKQPVTAEFMAILRAAKHMSEATDELYNPFILPALQKAGYKESLVPGKQADYSDDFSDKQVVPVSRLQLGDDWASIPYGTALDLGGCGKGYIGDVLAAKASQFSVVQGFWFALGGDVILKGLDANGEPWVVYLQPDPKSTRRIGEVVAPGPAQLAVATSTTLLRHGRHQGKAWHHIIDPRTGQPANSDIQLATVCSKSLIEADVLASNLIIVGSSGVVAALEPSHAVAAAWLTGGKRQLMTYGTGIDAYDQ